MSIHTIHFYFNFICSMGCVKNTHTCCVKNLWKYYLKSNWLIPMLNKSFWKIFPAKNMVKWPNIFRSEKQIFLFKISTVSSYHCKKMFLKRKKWIYWTGLVKYVGHIYVYLLYCACNMLASHGSRGLFFVTNIPPRWGGYGLAEYLEWVSFQLLYLLWTWVQKLS